MEMFFLSYVNETMYLLWNLPLFKTVPAKTNFLSFLKPWADVISIVLWLGDDTPVLSYLKNAYCGRGGWLNSLSLEVSLLSD